MADRVAPEPQPGQRVLLLAARPPLPPPPPTLASPAAEPFAMRCPTQLDVATWQRTLTFVKDNVLQPGDYLQVIHVISDRATAQSR